MRQCRVCRHMKGQLAPVWPSPLRQGYAEPECWRRSEPRVRDPDGSAPRQRRWSAVPSCHDTAAKLAAMATIPNFWLIGVRGDELDSAGKPRFLSQLQQRFRGRDLKREGRTMLIRDVPYPDNIHELQKQHGREYVQFYYAEEPLQSRYARPHQIAYSAIGLRASGRRRHLREHHTARRILGLTLNNRIGWTGLVLPKLLTPAPKALTAAARS
jgi:hypothetical protein